MSAKFFNYKPTLYKFLVLSMMLFASCVKTEEPTIVNNIGSGKPSFTVNGISDIILVNNSPYNNTVAKELTIQYLDSAQESVVLSLSPLPSGIALDSLLWVNSGIPTFSTTLKLYNNTDTGVLPGVYPMTVTATTASGKVKIYPFKLIIQGHPGAFLGIYDSCTASCQPGLKYSDSVFADANVRNKIWFSNFLNSGISVYGLMSASGTIELPTQAFGGDVISSGVIALDLAEHSIFIIAKVNSTYCNVNLR